MSLPTSPISVLIVGAGPSGLAAALSLHHQGIKDFVIVDALLAGQNSSRAAVIQAATLEVLDSVGCVDKLLKIGERTVHLGLHTTAMHTLFPFALIVPQTNTEAVMLETLEERGVHVLRPYKVVSLRSSADKEGMVDVTFESGETIQTKYVVGADGAHSVVRNEAGIMFADPDGVEPEYGSVSYIAIGDVTFSTPPQLPDPKFRILTSIANNNFMLMSPFPASVCPDPDHVVYRVGASTADPSIPHAPDKDYLQTLLDKNAPQVFSVPRTRSAVAQQTVTRLGGTVILVGDAAHIHSPIGGQGMSLGIRDSITLGAVLATCLISGSSSKPDEVLAVWAKDRQARAIAVVRATKAAMKMVVAPRTFFRRIIFGLIRFMGRFTFVKRKAAYNLSGLAEL
ncbi:FAD/NAD-P-binding domain-containing protein [Roridomyces roridus]|uniref:FAD/NAD-P-binding domain-containing protein n=1 Tax=Roridomyces roridus TaxID=1738132 RepID=A0AAD7C610_9AGAR|nr:FAD/NAD-P-binding domain-containing protein [Roridomyces roridus]